MWTDFDEHISLDRHGYTNPVVTKKNSYSFEKLNEIQKCSDD